MPEADRAKVKVAMTVMGEGEFHLVYTKALQSPIHELVVKKYRFLFFIHGRFLYFIHAFSKKSAKTPKKEIYFAKEIYKIIVGK